MVYISVTFSVCLAQVVAQYKTLTFDDFIHFRWNGNVWECRHHTAEYTCINWDNFEKKLHLKIHNTKFLLFSIFQQRADNLWTWILHFKLDQIEPLHYWCQHENEHSKNSKLLETHMMMKLKLTFFPTRYLISAADGFCKQKNLGQIHSLLIQLLFPHFLIWLSAFWNGSAHLPSYINNSEFILVFRQILSHLRYYVAAMFCFLIAVSQSVYNLICSLNLHVLSLDHFWQQLIALKYSTFSCRKWCYIHDWNILSHYHHLGRERVLVILSRDYSLEGTQTLMH